VFTEHRQHPNFLTDTELVHLTLKHEVIPNVALWLYNQ
jgi:hypothetical protein